MTTELRPTTTLPEFLPSVEPERAAGPTSQTFTIRMFAVAFGQQTEVDYSAAACGSSDEADGEVIREPTGLVRIANEPFDVEIEDDLVFLRHRVWSLVGSGRTLPEAERDLRAEADQLREVLLGLDPREMALETLRLREYLLVSL